MLTLIAYDIRNNPTRTKVHHILKEHGLNTQRSVFECEVTPETRAKLLTSISRLLDEETDSLRVYGVCEDCMRKVVTQGQGIKLLPKYFEIL